MTWWSISNLNQHIVENNDVQYKKPIETLSAFYIGNYKRFNHSSQIYSFDLYLQPQFCYRLKAYIPR